MTRMLTDLFFRSSSDDSSEDPEDSSELELSVERECATFSLAPTRTKHNNDTKIWQPRMKVSNQNLHSHIVEVSNVDAEVVA